MDLKNVTEQELRAELQRREEEKESLEQERREAQRKLIEDHMDLFLRLVPTHSRTSCSDDNPCNDYDCLRCHLLRAKEYNYWDIDYGIELQLVRYK